MSNEIITHKFRELFFPTLLITMALNINAIIDASFVATYIGHNGQAALQVLEPLIAFVTIFEWLFGLGGQILSLNKRAEFDEEGSNHYFTSALLTTIIISVSLLLFCFVFENAIINILQPTASVIPYVKAYAPYLIMSFPLITILGVLSQFIRVDGQPIYASTLIIISSMTNLILDYVFLVVFHMGIEGASFAMLLGFLLGMICASKYYFDSKRTFRFILSKLKFKSWIKSSVEIIKIGLPGASMGIFNLILVYVLNLILMASLGELGLDLFNVCVNSLLIISIFVLGFSETLSSIVPIYYSQNDYYNLNHIVRESIMLAIVCSILYMVFLFVYPDGLLMFFNLSHMNNNVMVENSLRIYSLSFVPMAFSNILIFYYEGIERSVDSGIISLISLFLGPLFFTFILYPFIGINSVWLSFFLGYCLSIVVVYIHVRIVERNTEYNGLFFIKDALIEKTRNYVLNNKDDEQKTMLFNHLKSLNVDNYSIETLNKIINLIFDLNDENILLEILLIDYDDEISINIKDEGKREVMKDVEKSFSQDNIKVSEVLGFNNINYTINKC